MTPHCDEDNSGVPLCFKRPPNGDVSFDRIEEGFEIPEDGNGEAMLVGDCFGNSVPFEGGSWQVASGNGGVAEVSVISVIFLQDRPHEASEDAYRGWEDPDSAFVLRVLFRDGSNMCEKALDGGDQTEDGVPKDVSEFVYGFVRSVDDVGNGKAVISSGRARVEGAEAFADVGVVDIAEDVLETLTNVRVVENILAHGSEELGAFLIGNWLSVVGVRRVGLAFGPYFH